MTNWIELDGVVNMRDVGGIPTSDGRTIAAGKLFRSDNLQDLSDGDIRALRDLGLTDVVDLRSDAEVRSTGPGPLTQHEWVQIHHHSFFNKSSGDATPPGSTPDAGPDYGETAPAAALPWVGLEPSASHDNPSTSHYLSYLHDRPDSVVAGLRSIADAEGAALVHCAAGKDRTGTLVALALLLVGAEPESVISDYATSSERVELILQRLLPTDTYGAVLSLMPKEAHLTHPETMRGLIEEVMPTADPQTLEQRLAPMGWTPTDTQRLREKLLG